MWLKKAAASASAPPFAFLKSTPSEDFTLDVLPPQNHNFQHFSVLRHSGLHGVEARLSGGGVTLRPRCQL